MTEKEIHHMARLYWDFDIIPPKEYILEVMNYIRNHPEYFKGLIPQ